MDFNKLILNVKRTPQPTDPQELFNSLTLRGGVNNIWGPQIEALKDWHSNHRETSDVVVRMNTGGGKTLVGLLIAQSIVNAQRKKVLYVCATNQLVEQTVQIAEDCGLLPAQRYRNEWKKREVFEEAESFCVTNYASLFNGHSVFGGDTIDAILLDDAHVAEHVVRDQFTLDFEATSPVYRQLLNLFRDYFSGSALATRCQDLDIAATSSLLFVPMFVVHRTKGAIRKVLLDNDVLNDSKNKYVWPHLQEKLEQCTIVFSRRRVQIAPLVLPVHTIEHYARARQRLYLTATMPTQVSFIRTFGIANPTTIEPAGKSGEAQKLFLFAIGESDLEQRESARQLVANYKACVISPSRLKARVWQGHASIFDATSNQETITEFLAAKDNRKLVFAGRYDGIDLPGDACRVLICDGMPLGEHLLNAFLDEDLRVKTIRDSHAAIRVSQAIGRIFRSNTDHGIVIIVGHQLQSWLRNPGNRGFLSPLLQRQIAIGLELDREIRAEKTSQRELVEVLLKGDKEWDEFYRKHMSEAYVEPTSFENGWQTALTSKESVAHVKLWDGQYTASVGEYSQLVDEASKYDDRLMAWYMHWHGLALQCSRRDEEAIAAFFKAGSYRAELGRPSGKTFNMLSDNGVGEPGFQAVQLATVYGSKRHLALRRVEAVIGLLTYGSETNKAEEAMKNLGELLGLEASRPEKVDKTGPDVIWIGEGTTKLAAFDLKTDKHPDGVYSKKDIMQAEDHAQWVRNKYGDVEFINAIVGRRLDVADQANPSSELLVIELEQFMALARRVEEGIKFVMAEEISAAEAYQRWLELDGLIWPVCLNALESRPASELKGIDEE